MFAYGERKMDDTTLVGRAVAGDNEAVAALYDRYADKLYDYSRFLTGNAADARDVMHDAFLLAMQRLAQLRDPGKFRPWVYAIVRTEVSRRRLRAARLHVGVWADDTGEPVSSDPTPTRAAEISELQHLIAEAAGGLSDDDREVLDLHLRHGLTGAEMATALAIPERHVSVTMQRVRERLARGLGVVLVGRAPTCPEFIAIRAREVEFTEAARKRLARHVDGCPRCSAERDTRMRPEVLLGALPMALAPLAIRATAVPQAVQLATGATGAAGSIAGGSGAAAGGGGTATRWLADGFPTLTAARQVSRVLIAAVGGTAALTGGAMLVMRDPRAESLPPTVAPITTSVAGTPVPTVGGPALTVITVTAPAVSTTVVTDGSSTPASPTTQAPATATPTAPPTAPATTPPTTPATTAATVPPTTGAPDTSPPVIADGQIVPFRISSQGPGGEGTCTTQITTVFAVAVADDVAPIAVTAVWMAPGGAARTTSLAGEGATWSGTIGPFPFAEIPVGDVVKYDVTVTARDASGNTTTRTFPGVGAVDSCPLP